MHRLLACPASGGAAGGAVGGDEAWFLCHAGPDRPGAASVVLEKSWAARPFAGRRGPVFPSRPDQGLNAIDVDAPRTAISDRRGAVAHGGVLQGTRRAARRACRPAC